MRRGPVGGVSRGWSPGRTSPDLPEGWGAPGMGGE